MPTITIRDLLPRVQMYRPDVVEAQCIWALQEAAKDIARFSGLAEMELAPALLPANVASQNVSALNTDTTIRTKRVKVARIAQVPSPSTYIGTWNATTNTPALDDVTLPAQYGFYVVSTAGTTSLGGITTWNAGDVLYSDGSAWKRIALESYTTIWPQNKPSTDRNVNQPQDGANMPFRYSVKDDTVYFYPRPGWDFAIQYLVSFEPVGDFETVEMNTDAIDGIVYGALDALYRLPGAGQNVKQAEVWRVRYLKERANMKTLGNYGDTGTTVIQPNNFLGRKMQYGPWRSTGWWL